MDATTIRRTRSVSAAAPAAIAAALLTLAMASVSVGAEPTPTSATDRTDVPDGAPQLAAEKSLGSGTVVPARDRASSVIVDEERVQGRLASARVSVGVSVGGTGVRSVGYSIVDPTAGRFDRTADNGGKHVAPSLWELLRF